MKPIKKTYVVRQTTIARVQVTYTHRDKDGVIWRRADSRWISELADITMATVGLVPAGGVVVPPKPQKPRSSHPVKPKRR